MDVRGDLSGDPLARRWQRAHRPTRLAEVVRQAEEMYAAHPKVSFTHDTRIPGVIAFEIIAEPERAVNSLGAVGPELRTSTEVNTALRMIHEAGLPILGKRYSTRN